MVRKRGENSVEPPYLRDPKLDRLFGFPEESGDLRGWWFEDLCLDGDGSIGENDPPERIPLPDLNDPEAIRKYQEAIVLRKIRRDHHSSRFVGLYQSGSKLNPLFPQIETRGALMVTPFCEWPVKLAAAVAMDFASRKVGMPILLESLREVFAAKGDLLQQLPRQGLVPVPVVRFPTDELSLRAMSLSFDLGEVERLREKILPDEGQVWWLAMSSVPGLSKIRKLSDDHRHSTIYAIDRLIDRWIKQMCQYIHGYNYRHYPELDCSHGLFLSSKIPSFSKLGTRLFVDPGT